jgi:SPP1 family predicted phage head-tail adaptor
VKPLAYKLRHRVDIQEFTTLVDSETGAVSEVWVSLFGNGDFAPGAGPGAGPGPGTGAESDPILMPAEIMPMSGREFVAASAIQAGVNTKITIRYMEGIKPSMRVVNGSEIYDIKAVLPDPTLRRHITLMCASGVNIG